MLSQITEAGVQSAIREFDRLGRDEFLEKYGFGRSRAFFILLDGRRYDSKAICGVAHGYDVPDEGPLSAATFSGGHATVERKLKSLGFDVLVVEPSSRGWTHEERVLALELYLQHGAVNKNSAEARELSEELNRRAFHPDAGTRADFRNTNGVGLKLANFSALDPANPGSGMKSFSAGDEQTWETFAGDEDLLALEVARIRSGHVAEPIVEAADQVAVSIERSTVEQQHNADHLRTLPGGSVIAHRREATLVLDFEAFLTEGGNVVEAHTYYVAGIALRNDLADSTNQTIWEAKSQVNRTSVRSAIGQLLDYRRFEPSDWTIGVLLPRRPHKDLCDLIASVPAHLAFPRGDGSFELIQTQPIS